MTDIIVSEKVCTECKLTLPVSNFYIDYFVSTKIGYTSKCKQCVKQYQKTRKSIEKDLSIKTKICNKCLVEKEITEFYKSTRHKTGFNAKCKECHNETLKNKGNNSKIKRKGEYLELAKQKKYNTPHNKMKYALRKSLLDRLQLKCNKTIDYLGATINFFKLWMEYQFSEDMNWDNHGTFWHIDHVKPCSSFNFENENEIFKCWNWKNLRPLNKFENIKKSNKINEEIIISQNDISQKFLDKNSEVIKYENSLYDLTAS